MINLTFHEVVDIVWKKMSKDDPSKVLIVTTTKDKVEIAFFPKRDIKLPTLPSPTGI